MLYQKFWLRIALSVGIVWIWCGDTADARDVTYQHLYEGFHQGDDFFVVGERIYLLLRDNSEEPDITRSVIAST